VVVVTGATIAKFPGQTLTGSPSENATDSKRVHPGAS
jgi:hypothetical protein